MSRSPRCALCGQEIGPNDHIMLELQSIAGRPRLAWHLECAVADDGYAMFLEAEVSAEQLARQICDRGADRITAGTRWWRSVELSCRR